MGGITHIADKKGGSAEYGIIFEVPKFVIEVHPDCSSWLHVVNVIASQVGLDELLQEREKLANLGV